MNHIDNHPHAFLDKNNIVTSVFLFDGHNPSLLEQVREFWNADTIKCCCDNGMAEVGGDFYNGKFYPPKPFPEWIRDEQKGDWIAPEGWVFPDTLA